MEFHEGKWMCSACGACFKKRRQDGCALQGRNERACPGKCQIREEIHISHEGHTANQDLRRDSIGIQFGMRGMWLRKDASVLI